MAQTVMHTDAANQYAYLVKFSYGSSPTIKRYARWDSDVVVGADTYVSAGTDGEGAHLMGFTFSEQHGGTRDAEIKIIAPRSLAPFNGLSTGLAHSPVSVTVFECVIGNEAGTIREVYFGRVKSARRNPSGRTRQVELTIKGIKADLGVTLGMAMTTGCQSWLGHPLMCQIDLDAIKETANDATLNANGQRNRITVSSATTVDFATRKLWANGWVEFDDLRIRIRRVIDGEASATEWQATNNYSIDGLVNPASTPTGLRYRVTTDGGSSGGSEPTWPTTAGGTVSDGGLTWTAESVGRFSLTRQPPTEWAGQALTLVPGCDGTISTCRDVHDNETRFTGFGFGAPDRQILYETA
ncbi:MAG: hypothetical protein COA96_16760 [SAR86 cluster bacterium]|uniref:Bacteriophage phiJL001 Gp84 C-terminal domain-containing protein n=1 Tax=SAR86 cluster bacterium TaxID=2030880 RepID=A0A2A5AGQ6_9GAMM|nr:MAG: hypothetical protein COA96_16760 [SAR86 cluster bacterium]